MIFPTPFDGPFRDLEYDPPVDPTTNHPSWADGFSKYLTELEGRVRKLEDLAARVQQLEWELGKPVQPPEGALPATVMVPVWGS